MTLFISTIIPTIGRPTLSRAVLSVLEQKFADADFEVIVVNDSVHPLEHTDWHDSPRVQILQTNCRERSIARNTGAAVARGNYLHFLDDDDWMLPGAFDYFWKLIQQKKAAMYYGGYRFVNSDGHLIQEFYPDEDGNCFIRFMSGEWQPLQASLFDTRVFHSVGGFTALEILRGGDEDVDLTRRISLEHDIAGVKQLVATIRTGREGSTTNYADLHQQSLQSREIILNSSRAFSRLHQSAKERLGTSEYWHGRMLWIYLGSAVWNIQHYRMFIALSRLMYVGLALSISFKYWFSLKFWQGATKPHYANGWLVQNN
jgi:glycosyltransferase involved in cell wall biosynthesis